MVVKANALSRWIPGWRGTARAAEWGQPMATGVMDEPMRNQTHVSETNQQQTQTKHGKAAASSLCNKYCKAHLVSFFFFFKSNITTNVPNPVFSIQERSCCYQQNTCSQSKKKNRFPLAGQSKSFSSLSSQSGLFTFLKSDLNKAPDLGELPGKPYTEAQIKKKKKKEKVRNKNKRFLLVKI